MKVIALIAVALVGAALAAPAPGGKLLGRRTGIPKQWTKLQRAAAGEHLTFYASLPQQNLEKLEAIYWDITNPDSPNYQNWLSSDELLEMTNPPAYVRDYVRSWIESEGAVLTRDFGHSLHFECTVAVAERLFNTEFYYFVHESGKRIVKQWGEFSLPAHAAAHIDLVLGLSEFPLEKTSLIRQPMAGVPALDPISYRTQYTIPSTASASGASEGVVQWEAQYVDPDDTAAFCKDAGIDCTVLPPDHYIGINNPNAPGIEATLDIEMISSTAGADADNWVWENNGDAWLYGFGVNLTAWKGVVMALSMSYGWNEEDQCEQGIGYPECQQLGVDSKGFVAKVNSLFMQAGTMGFTIFAASGDSGVNGRTDPDCSENHFNPPFPAASPYLTAVGATEPFNAVIQSNPSQLCTLAQMDCVQTSSERAVSIDQAHFASGGGFSNVALMPAYQQSFVANYLSNAPNLPPTSYFNTSGRAFPDVAAYGSGNLIAYGVGSNIQVIPVGGTSASSPIFLGIITLLNAQIIKKTGKPMGPANPLLYKMYTDQPSCFSDITIGNNTCTEDGCFPSCKGFQCTTGWDPVTGLGTPKTDCMLQYVSNMLDKKLNKH